MYIFLLAVCIFDAFRLGVGKNQGKKNKKTLTPNAKLHIKMSNKSVLQIQTKTEEEEKNMCCCIAIRYDAMHCVCMLADNSTKMSFDMHTSLCVEMHIKVKSCFLKYATIYCCSFSFVLFSKPNFFVDISRFSGWFFFLPSSTPSHEYPYQLRCFP